MLRAGILSLPSTLISGVSGRNGHDWRLSRLRDKLAEIAPSFLAQRVALFMCTLMSRQPDFITRFRLFSTESPLSAIRLLSRSSLEERRSLRIQDWRPLLRRLRRDHPSDVLRYATSLAYVPSAVNNPATFEFLRSTGHPGVLLGLCIHARDERWMEIWRDLSSEFPSWAMYLYDAAEAAASTGEAAGWIVSTIVGLTQGDTESLTNPVD